ncbi:MAG TPA: hypothetical protein VNI84_08540 [Pyrinomonadaceae bacterium]|nr:hypothetical protein [Pyrinomonadaceae bacterium]
MLPIIGLVILATIFSGLFCLVGKADKNAHPIFGFWSFIIFGGGFGALFLLFLPISLPITGRTQDFLALIGFVIGGLSGSFLGWKYAVKLKNSRNFPR